MRGYIDINDYEDATNDELAHSIGYWSHKFDEFFEGDDPTMLHTIAWCYYDAVIEWRRRKLGAIEGFNQNAYTFLDKGEPTN